MVNQSQPRRQPQPQNHNRLKSQTLSPYRQLEIRLENFQKSRRAYRDQYVEFKKVRSGIEQASELGFEGRINNLAEFYRTSTDFYKENSKIIGSLKIDSLIVEIDQMNDKARALMENGQIDLKDPLNKELAQKTFERVLDAIKEIYKRANEF